MNINITRPAFYFAWVSLLLGGVEARSENLLITLHEQEIIKQCSTMRFYPMSAATHLASYDQHISGTEKRDDIQKSQTDKLPKINWSTLSVGKAFTYIVKEYFKSLSICLFLLPIEFFLPFEKIITAKYELIFDVENYPELLKNKTEEESMAIRASLFSYRIGTAMAMWLLADGIQL